MADVCWHGWMDDTGFYRCMNPVGHDGAHDFQLPFRLTVGSATPEPLKIQCAWCGVLVRDGKLPLSHGLCRACRDTLLAKMKADDATHK